MQTSPFAVLSLSIVVILLSSLVCTNNNDIIHYGTPGRNLPQLLAPGEIQYYLVNTTSWGMSEGDFVTLSLNSLSGDCDMWISTVDYPKSACADCLDRDSNGFGDVKIIYYNTTEYAQGIFYVGIVATERIAEFTFMAWGSNKIININKNELIFVESPRGKKNVFSFDIPSEATLITISVNGIFGDPDLHVSGSNGAEWISEEYGFDALKIKVVPELTRLNISVLAFSESVYNVIINVNDESMRLPEGVFVRDTVNENEMDTFLFRSLESVLNIVVEAVEVRNQEGETKLYIRKGSKPTRAEFDAVISLTGDEKYTIKSATVGDYYIGVYGLMNSTNYKIWAFGENPDQVELLTNQLVQRAFNSNVKSYTFKYVNNDLSKTITATIKVVSGISINVYEAQFSRPSSSKYTRKAVATPGADGIIKFEAPSPQPFIYFTVTADAGEFSIQITTTQPITALNNAEELYLNWVPKGSYRYFSFVADKYPNSSISITTKPSTGDVDLYVSTIHQFPSAETNQWVADKVGVDTVYIASNDSKAFGNIFYIAVYAYDSDSYFSISASQIDSITSISIGDSISSSVLENSYAYYVLNVKSSGKIYINLNLLKSGDEADLFYSKTVKTPNRYDFDGRSINIGNDVLTIEDAIPGELYISVYGIVSSNLVSRIIPYTLSVSTDYLNLFPNGDTVLINSTKGQVTHFRADITESLRILTASASLISGKTVMYISTNGEKANKTNFVWSDSNRYGNSILIKQKDLKLGIWFIAVEAIENSVYHMSLASNIGATVQENVLTLGRTASDGNMDSIVYSFWLPFTEPSKAKDVYLYIKEVDGPVNVYVNQDMFNYPTEENYVWRSLSNGSNSEVDRVITLKNESLALDKAIFVSVLGKVQGNSSLFSLAFRVKDIPVPPPPSPVASSSGIPHPALSSGMPPNPPVAASSVRPPHPPVASSTIYPHPTMSSVRPPNPPVASSSIVYPHPVMSSVRPPNPHPTMSSIRPHPPVAASSTIYPHPVMSSVRPPNPHPGVSSVKPVPPTTSSNSHTTPPKATSSGIGITPPNNKNRTSTTNSLQDIIVGFSVTLIILVIILIVLVIVGFIIIRKKNNTISKKIELVDLQEVHGTNAMYYKLGDTNKFGDTYL